MIRYEGLFFLTLMTLVILTLTILLHEIISIKEGDYQHAYAFENVNKNTGLSDFNFAAVGDWGCTNNTKNTVDNIVDNDPELILGLGDYAYANKANCWIKLIDPIDNKMKIVIGNHDHLVYTNKNTSYSSASRLQQYTGHFNLTRQYYSFNYQNVHFVAMSTEVPFEVGSKQYDFVENDLKKATSDSNIDWIVVFYHRVAYTSLVFPGSASNLKVRETFHPLFEKYGVDLVIQGHIHSYQRSYPIKYNSEDSFKPIVTDKNTTNYNDPKGQIFTIVGTGGASDMHNLTGPSRPYMAAKFNAFGFLDINVIHNGTMLVGEFHDNNGTIKDHFTITKSGNKKQENNNNSPSPSPLSGAPRLMGAYNDKFRIESVFKGLRLPTDMEFLGPKDIIVLEKNNGTVQRLVNGQKLDKPLLDVNVSNKNERGLLGIAVSKANDGTRYVFLYYTETEKEGSDICPKPYYCVPGNDPEGNRLYRYELSADGNKLIKPKLLLDLPATPGPAHNGGKVILGSDKKLFLTVGDVRKHKSKSQNYESGKEPVGIGGILNINQDGNISYEGYLGSKYPLNLYYAYGIRNSFGLDFDPVAGNLWDTENGPSNGDEINLVKPGFNSGWEDVQGIWNFDDRTRKIQKGPLHLDGLEDFNGKGTYSAPEFTWKHTVGPTAIKFFNSDKMGIEYKDSLFVGDFHRGNLYHFSLNGNRTSLLLNGSLADGVANTPEELNTIIFAGGFGGISDLEVGPDGYLYVLSLGNGEIYRIVPR